MDDLQSKFKSLLKRVPIEETPEAVRDFIAKQNGEVEESPDNPDIDMVAFMKRLAYSGKRDREREKKNEKWKSKVAIIQFQIPEIRRQFYKNFYSAAIGDDIEICGYYYDWHYARVRVQDLERTYNDNLSSPYSIGLRSYRMKKKESDNPYNRETDKYKWLDWFSGWHKSRRDARDWEPDEGEYEAPEV